MLKIVALPLALLSSPPTTDFGLYGAIAKSIPNMVTRTVISCMACMSRCRHCFRRSRHCRLSQRTLTS
eukprot:3458057-Pyramimonas_sp.AAC.1